MLTLHILFNIHFPILGSNGFKNSYYLIRLFLLRPKCTFTHITILSCRHPVGILWSVQARLFAVPFLRMVDLLPFNLYVYHTAPREQLTCNSEFRSL